MNTIAQTIYNQMNGNAFAQMVGVKQLGYTENSLTIKFKARAKNSINCVVITLNAMDTYDVKFWSLRGTSAKVKEEYTGLYNDQLREIFTRETGLYTSLRG